MLSPSHKTPTLIAIVLTTLAITGCIQADEGTGTTRTNDTLPPIDASSRTESPAHQGAAPWNISPHGPTTTTTQPIIAGGVDAADTTLPNAHASQRRRDATVRVNGYCSGTLISPRLVLTAAHCVDDWGRYPIAIFTNVDADWGKPPNFPEYRPPDRDGDGNPDNVLTPIGCFRHPDYAGYGTGENPDIPPSTEFTPSFSACGTPVADLERTAFNDLAVVALSERVEYGRSGNHDIVPARPSFDHQPPNTTTRLAGYGYIDHLDTPTTVRRYIIASIDGYGDGISYPANGAWGCGFPGVSETAAGFNTFTNQAMIFAPDSTGGGDSGGSVLIGDPDTEDLRLVAVISGSKQLATWINCPIGSPVFYHHGIVNHSWTAPLSNASNAAWLQQFLTSAVDNPAANESGSTPGPGEWDPWPTPIYLGDWDLPLRGEPERNAPEYAALRALDRDGDGLIDEHDNCPTVYNPEQRDSAGANGVDVRLDGVANFADCAVVPVVAAVM